MRNISPPPLRFGSWARWSERHRIPGSGYPGVYMLTINRRDLHGKRAPVEQAHYIGMSNNRKGLQGRWYQLHRAICGLRGHSGGNTIFAELGHYESWEQQLFVAALAVPCNPSEPGPRDYLLMGIVAYLEYKAFAVFAYKRPRLNKPKYNTQ